MLAILQCRLKSTRLQGKLLHTFFGETILQRMINIAHQVPSVSKVVVAIGGEYGHLLLKKITEDNKANAYIGNEQNVLSRFIDISKSYKSDYFLRLTCDNYLAQPHLIELLYNETIRKKSDYGYIEPLSHFCGEIILKKKFINFYKMNTPTSLDVEHVTTSLRESKKIKKTILNNFFFELDHSKSLTLDNLDDLLIMKELENKYPRLSNYNCLDELKKIIKTKVG